MTRKPPRDWENLVTDGHVLAARMRRAGPRVIAIGTLAVMLGGGFLAAGPRLIGDVVKPVAALLRIEVGAPAAFGASAPRRPVDAEGEARARDMQEAARQAAASLPDIKLDRATFEKLSGVDDLDGIRKDIVGAMKGQKTVPVKIADIPLKAIDTKSFWTSAWPTDAVVVTSAPGVVAFGGVIKDNFYAYRFILVGRLIGDEWVWRELQTSQSPRTRRATPANEMADTLKKLGLF